MSPDRIVSLDAAMVKILAHPLRSRLLGLLNVHGPATATELAHKIGTNSGATSYHLRQLADIGLIEEDHERGNARERWWKPAQRGITWQPSDHDDDPDAQAASDWLIRYLHRRYGRMVEDWLDVRMEWPLEWRQAADQSDFGILVNTGQLREFNDKVAALAEEYRLAADPDDPKAERVMILHYAFPLAAVEI